MLGFGRGVVVVCLSAVLSIFISNFAFAQPKSPISATPVKKTSIEGTVRDFDSQQPIPFVTVQVEGTGQSTLANEAGFYRLIVEEGPEYQLKCSHIAYYSERATVATIAGSAQQDFSLHSALVEIPGTTVFDRAADPAQRIILEAIARKKDILSKLHDYSFDAYTKLIVRDSKKPDSVNIFLITETQVTSYWEQPDKYKEVITARKQSKNIEAEENLVSVGEILNFNKNRIEAGEMSIVSPTATDALDFYNYFLIDTTFLDSQQVFVLAIEPKNELETLFKGTIHIADSTFDVVAVDVGFSGLRTNIIKNPRYSQKYAQFHNEYWMPVEIRFSADIKLPIPIPTIPSELSFSHVASLYDFSIEKGIPKGTFGEVELEVAEEADSFDSTTWNAKQTIPLTTTEVQSYTRIDSIEAIPKPIGKQIAFGLIALPFLISSQEDLFHFNRAEGAYLGLGAGSDKLIPRMSLYGKGGYAFGAEYWQYQAGGSYDPWKNWPLTLSAEYHDQMRHNPTVLHGSGGNMTMAALWDQSDPFNYYKEDGFTAGVKTKLLNKTRLTVGYNNLNQHSVGLSHDSLNSDYSFFGDEDSIRANPFIADGQLRSVTADFTYDSRPRVMMKGKVAISAEPIYTQLSIGMEHSSPELLSSDFDFTRYYATVTKRQRTLGMGVTSLFAYYGASDKPLPPQRYFAMEYSPLGILQGRGFQTLGDANFTGDRLFAVCVKHEFRRSLWVKSGIPGVKRIPWNLSLHGGAFWTDFKHQAPPDTVFGRVARTAYTELGFDLGNLTPFMSPFNLEIGFTWQLSAYDTNKFGLSFDLAF
jgi:hypothetical protein